MSEGVAFVEMMYKTNILVLVYEKSKHKVVIWDDCEKKNRTEISFNNSKDIRNIKVSKEMLLVALEDSLFIFNFDTLKLIE